MTDIKLTLRAVAVEAAAAIEFRTVERTDANRTNKRLFSIFNITWRNKNYSHIFNAVLIHKISIILCFILKDICKKLIIL